MVRQRHLGKERRLLGKAIALCPKPKIFKEYILMEKALGELFRCRVLYEKYIESGSGRPLTSVEFCDFEKCAGENERCRALYELALEEHLDAVELVWRKYINFEVDNWNIDVEEILFRRLRGKNDDLRVWRQYLLFAFVSQRTNLLALQGDGEQAKRHRYMTCAFSSIVVVQRFKLLF